MAADPTESRAPRFVVDAHLGRLAVYLRLLGFDALYDPHRTDAALLAASHDEGRILLTRDRALLRRGGPQRTYEVQQTTSPRQLKEVLARFDLFALATPFTRCLRCNTLLVRLPRPTAAQRLPPPVLEQHAEFWQCPDCERIYWQGSHYRNMERVVQELLTPPAGDA